MKNRKKIISAILLFAIFALALGGCGTTKEFVLEKKKKDPNKGYYVPETPIQKTYYGSATQGLITPLEHNLASQVKKYFIEKNSNPPKEDDNLTLVGKELARYFVISKNMPPLSFQKQVAVWMGVGEYDITTHYHSFIGSVDIGKFDTALKKTFKQLNKRFAPNYIGVGVYESKTSAETMIALVTMRRLVSFKEFPKKIQPGKQLAIFGRLLNPSWNALATFTLPGKPPQAMKVNVTSDGSFEIKVSLPKNIPNFSFELSAETKRARKPLAGFDIYQSGSEPNRYKYPDIYKDGEITPDGMEQLFVEWLNRDRKLKGLTELAEKKSVSRLATDWAARGCVDAQTAKNQFENRKIHVFHFRTLCMKGGKPHEMYQNILKSPTYKLALFDPNFTHIGVGAYIVGVGKNRKIIISVAMLSAPISNKSKILKREYIKRLNNFRISNGLLPLKYDKRLYKTLKKAIKDLAIRHVEPSEVRADVKAAIQNVKPSVQSPATTYFNILTLDSKLPAPVAKSLLRPERDSISFAIRPISNPESEFKGYLIYYVVFSK